MLLPDHANDKWSVFLHLDVNNVVSLKQNNKENNSLIVMEISQKPH